MILWIIAIVAVVVAYYVVWGRECMKRKPWSRPIFDRIEPIEIALWRKSRTLLWARFKMLLAAIIGALGAIGTLDISAILPFVPDKHKWWVSALPPAALALDGIIQEITRRITTKPLELVAIQEEKLPPETRVAVEMAAETKAIAIEAVKEAK